jgi:ferredoxin
MIIQTTTLITFSPTHTTERVLDGIARGIAAPVQRLDLTPPTARTRPLPRLGSGIAVMGAPVYGGRIPPEATRRIRRVRADGVPAAVVVVYGNREYEDALLELRDIAVECGFVPVAGAAFIGEHSYDSPETPIATGRPDAADLADAADFGAAVRTKLAYVETMVNLPALQVPGDFPYRQRHEVEAGAPTTVDDLCTRCGDCVEACPMGAIDADDPTSTDRSLCIFCSACLKACPAEARVWEVAWVGRASRWLTESCAARKEPETYL